MSDCARVVDSTGGEMEERLLTLDDLAGYLSVSRRTVYRLLEGNSIPAYRVGGQVRFRREDIDKWLETKKIGKTKIG